MKKILILAILVSFLVPTYAQAGCQSAFGWVDDDMSCLQICEDECRFDSNDYKRLCRTRNDYPYEEYIRSLDKFVEVRNRKDCERWAPVFLMQCLENCNKQYLFK